MIDFDISGIRFNFNLIGGNLIKIDISGITVCFQAVKNLIRKIHITGGNRKIRF